MEKGEEPGYYRADPMLYGLLKEFAKENRQKETPAEMLLWKFVRGSSLGVHIRRQYIIGAFIADFACLSKKLIIEIDGGYHSLPSQEISDEERTQWMESRGFRVIRFSNEEVMGDIEGVINKIKQEIK